MATRDFIINEKGELQRPLKFDRGDVVSFHAYGSDIVLCFEPPTAFGAKRIEIAKGEKVTLAVNPETPEDHTFDYYCCNDLTYKCGEDPKNDKDNRGRSGTRGPGGPVGGSQSSS